MPQRQIPRSLTLSLRHVQFSIAVIIGNTCSSPYHHPVPPITGALSQMTDRGQRKYRHLNH
jgi:hypothetical protein